jgi:hypothetical protein
MGLLALASSAHAGLILNWQLNEGTGTAVSDSSGSNFNASLVGSPALPTWEAVGYNGIGSAIRFTSAASDQSILATTFTGTGITGTSARTFAAWINVDTVQTDTAGQFIAEYGASVNGQRFTVALNATAGSTIGALRFEVGGGAVVATTDLRGRGWTHIAVVLDGGTASDNVNEARLYVNGVQEAFTGTSGSFTINTTVSATAFFKVGEGNSNTGRHFLGAVDDIRLYDNALTAGDVLSLSAIPEPSTYAALAGLATLGFVAVRRNRRSA